MSIKFSVVKSAGAMVSPAEPTPGGELSLSVIDQLPGLRRKVQTLHFFRHGEKVAEVMRAAIAKALGQYYPLAGRLRESGPGQLVLECSGEGIWLVEASVECNPKVEVADLIDGSCEGGTTLLFDLLPQPPMDKDGFDPLVLMQVTTFPCKGYVIGLEFSHVICDGLGAAQFLGAVAEFARGHERLSIEPAWGREALLAKRSLSVTTAPVPLQPPPPPPPDHSLKQATVDVHPTHIDELKREFLTQTGKTCSTFEVLTASVWKSRTEAIAVDEDVEVVLVFFANVRPYLDPPLPRGFYGNCFFPVNVKAAAGKIRDGSLADAVRLVQEAKSRVADEFKKWVDGGDGGGGDPFLPPLAYTTLFVTEWGRLGFGGVDYGWGPPAYVMPIQYSNVVPGCVVGSPPTPRKGVRLITWCVRDAHLAAFRDGLVQKPARNGDQRPVFPVEHNDNENLN